MVSRGRITGNFHDDGDTPNRIVGLNSKRYGIALSVAAYSRTPVSVRLAASVALPDTVFFHAFGNDSSSRSTTVINIRSRLQGHADVKQYTPRRHRGA